MSQVFSNWVVNFMLLYRVVTPLYQVRERAARSNIILYLLLVVDCFLSELFCFYCWIISQTVGFVAHFDASVPLLAYYIYIYCFFVCFFFKLIHLSNTVTITLLLQLSSTNYLVREQSYRSLIPVASVHSVLLAKKNLYPFHILSLG